MDKSIEEATIQVQQDKRKLMQLAFSEKAGKRDNAKFGRLDDIRRLLQSVEISSGSVDRSSSGRGGRGGGRKRA